MVVTLRDQRVGIIKYKQSIIYIIKYQQSDVA